MKSFKDFAITPVIENFVGDKIAINKLLDKEIIVKAFNIKPSKFEGKGDRLDIQIEFKDEDRVIFTGAKYLLQTIQKVPKTEFPFKTKIIKNGEHLEFA
jgi:phosphorylcholine metabolism protein LicD